MSQNQNGIHVVFKPKLKPTIFHWIGCQIAGMSVLFDIEGCSWRHSPKLKTLLALVKIFYVSWMQLCYWCKGASIYDVRKTFGFFDIPPCHCHKSADFVPFVRFLGDPPPLHPLRTSCMEAPNVNFAWKIGGCENTIHGQFCTLNLLRAVSTLLTLLYDQVFIIPQRISGWRPGLLSEAGVGEHVVLLPQHAQGEQVDSCASFRDKTRAPLSAIVQTARDRNLATL